MNPYCMFDLSDLGGRVSALGALFRSHAAGLTSISLVSDAAAQTCLTRKILRPLKLPVVAPVLATVSLFATTTIVDALGTDAILFRPTIPDGLAAQSSRTKTFIVTSSASFCSSAYSSGGCSHARHTRPYSRHSGGAHY